MKKVQVLMMLVLLFTALFSNHSASASGPGISTNVNIAVNGQRIHPDAAPFIKNDRTLIPLRSVFEQLGADVQWIEDQRTVTVKYKDKAISLQIDNRQATVNNNTASMDVAPMIYNDRTMIPLRFVAEGIGLWVNWIPGANLATVTEPSYFDSMPSVTVLGFTTNDYKGDNGSYDSLAKYADNINSIATFSYQMDENGNLNMLGMPQDATVGLANSKGIKPLALVHNFKDSNFNRDLAHAVLSNSSKRKKLIDNILTIIGKNEYSGVNIDIENVYGYDRQNYSALIKELKERLTPCGFLTTISAPAKTNDNYPNNNWIGAFDYPELGKYADKIVIMTYDEHYFGGPAGPVASYPWVENVVKYATSVIPAKKILLGIPSYGYDWANTGNKAVLFKNAENLIRSIGGQSFWDDTAKSPYTIYNKDGVSHTVWYENSQSISHKLNLLESYGLGGIGIWRLGYDNDSFWDAIKSSPVLSQAALQNLMQ